MKERLQKILARAGIASRRRAEEFIRAGRVTVDGEVVTELGRQVDPARHRIECDGTPIPQEERKVYVLLNKPKGYLSTVRDPQGRAIVTDLVSDIDARLFPVGRLDQETEGALLLTNDGEFANRILHPSFEIDRTYIAKVKGSPAAAKLARLEKGIELEGRKTWPAQLKVLRRGAAETTIEIVIHEGRKRQVRKMFAAIGHPVLSLKRIAYGGLTLGRLPQGKYRFLQPRDLERIFRGKNPLYNKDLARVR